MTEWRDRPAASRSVVRARHGMAATAHPLASESAVRVLREGGSAVDAAIAANAVLGLVEPVACGLGGDLFALLWDPVAHRLAGLDASGRAPRSARPDRMHAGPDGTIPLHSPQAWTVPGCASGWFALHGRYGRLPVDRLLADAVRLAREGFPVSEVVARAWARGAELHAATPGFADVFLPGGVAPREGDVFRNPALARTLERMAEGGPDGFYRGETAERLSEYSAERGGLLEEADLAAHEATWVEPLSVSHAGHELWELPPAGQGLAALEMLALADAAGLEGLRRDEADWWHVLVEAKKLAFADRARHFADPAFHAVPVRELLDPARLRRLAARIDRARAADVEPPDDLRAGAAETTYLATADESGLMVSLIQSNYTGFGSGHAVPSLGFGLQNRGALFALEARHPNVVAPGKRPFHTIIPAFVTREGRPWLAFGVMGGDMQPQGHVQVLLNLLDHGMNLQEAGDAPRFHHGGSSEPTGLAAAGSGELHLEPDVPAGVARELARRGHVLAERPGVFGGYQAVALDGATGCFLGATERRKDGCALGW